MSTLVLVTPPIPVDGSAVLLTTKTSSGLGAIMDRWPGPVHVVARPAKPTEVGSLGGQWVELNDTPFPIHLGDPVALLESLKADVIQAPLTLTDQPAGRTRIPVVIVAENPSRERLRYAMSTGDRRNHPRMVAGAFRQHFALNAVVRRAQGLACNGWASWDSFRKSAGAHRVDPILFFDTRLSGRHVLEATTLRGSRPVKNEPLTKIRLAFSGRFHAAKGPQHAVQIASLLAGRRIPHSMTLIGSGPLEPELRASAGATVAFVRPLPFAPDWVNYVAHNVDVMVLPHVQGDPSGTYLESAGLGVPIAGFANRALAGHAENIGLGWTVKVGDVPALAQLIIDLSVDARRVAIAGQRGAEFMEQHTMELEFDRRVDHLLRVLAEAKR